MLIEALAAGLPVIASDVPACREVLEDGQWGTLVPPNDAEALVNATKARLAIRLLQRRQKEDGVGRIVHPIDRIGGQDADAGAVRPVLPERFADAVDVTEEVGLG